MRIALGSDHRGFYLKEEIKKYLEDYGHTYIDFGTESAESVDYPEFGYRVAEAVVSGKCERGIVICRTGIGTSITANKIPGIKAALCHDIFTTKKAREDNDANVLALGADVVEKEIAKEMVKLFLVTKFSGGRHTRRLAKLKKIEEKYLKNTNRE
jgi:ribose 5-phosphate isomerase B